MAARGILSQLVDLAKAVASAARSTPSTAPEARTATTTARRSPSRPPEPRSEPRHTGGPTGSDAVHPSYAPERDGEPDPGEVVWAWVPYEEDASRGKDRPVLVLSVDDRGDAGSGGARGGEVVALMLTSKDHVGASSRDAADELRHGRRWMDVGSGGWDAQGRPSEVRLDRVLRLPVTSVRREGAALDERVFSRVAEAASRLHGWS